MPVIVKEYHNNFKIVYEKSHSDLPITALYIFCDVGPVYEYDKMRGASHFVEHMCFKGTKKIPHSKDIFHEYAKIGADFNAFTSKRYTCYTVKCQDIYVQHCLDILSDMLSNSLFDKVEFTREEKVVIEENNNNDNNPEYLLELATNRIIYAGSSYEFPADCLDYHKNRNLDHKNIVEFYRDYYRQNHMFLSVVSNLPFKEIESYFKHTLFCKKITDRREPIRVINQCITPQSNIRYQIIKKRGVTNAHINIGFRVCGRNNSDKYGLLLLEKIMGDGLSGRLLMVLRERNGLVYGASATTEFYEQYGGFTFSTKTKRENFSQVLPLLVQIIGDMIKNGVTNEELLTVKGNFKGNVLLSLQSIVTQAQYNGEEIIFNLERNSTHSKIIPYQDVYDKCIRDITVSDVNRIIKHYFTRENMCVCVLSEKLPSLEIIQKECASII
jgi:predicted Zn-dependent peptidase